MLRRISAITLTFLVLLITPAWSQVFDLTGGVSVTQEQINALQNAFAKTNQDIVFFHWMDRTNGVRWISQGALDQGEVSYFNIPTGQLQAFGPGVYLAQSPVSSKSFGTVAVGVKVNDGTPIYDQANATKILGATLTNEQIAKLGEQIPFIRELTPNDWHVTNHVANLQSLSYGGLHDPLAAAYYPPYNEGWKPAEILDLLNPFIQKGDNDAVYLKKLLLSTDYMDGISWARAMMVNPGAPWNEFEPEHFGNYENATRVADNLQKALPTGTQFQAKDVRSVMDQIHTAAIGSQTPLRTEGIRAGGTEDGQRFKVDANELKALQANPFLTVEASAPDADGHSLVDYYYPDAFHYQGVKQYLSPQLVTDLDAANKLPNGLLDNSNADLRHSLNQRVEGELLDQVDAGKIPVDNLIDIHAYDDDNGRTSRIVKGLYHNQPPHNFIGDFDTELPADQYAMWVQKGFIARNSLHADLLNEFLMAKGQGRMPDYLKSGAVQKYVNAAFPVFDTIDITDKNVQEQIRQREWDQIVGKNEQLAVKNFFSSRASQDINAVAQEFMGMTSAAQIALYDEPTRVLIMQTLGGIAENKSINLNSRVNAVGQYEAYLPQVPVTDMKPIDKAVLMDSMLNDFTASVNAPPAGAGAATNWSDLTTLDEYNFVNQLDADGFKQLTALNRQMLADATVPTTMKAMYVGTYQGAANILAANDPKKALVMPAREATNDLIQSIAAEAKKYPTQILQFNYIPMYLSAPSTEGDYFMIHLLPNLDALHQQQVKTMIGQSIDSYTQQVAMAATQPAVMQTYYLTQQSKQAQSVVDQIFMSKDIGDDALTRDLLNRYTNFYQALLKNANLGKGKKLPNIPRPGQIKVQLSGKTTYQPCVDGFLQKIF